MNFCHNINSLTVTITPLLSPPSLPRVEINGVAEEYYCDFYHDLCISESGYYVDTTGEHNPEPILVPLNEGEKITGVNDRYSVTTNFGRRLYMNGLDITDLLGDSDIVGDIHRSENQEHDLILSSGDRITISRSTIEIKGKERISGLNEGETIKTFEDY